MSLIIYTYKSCDTCRKALNYLDDRKLSYELRQIIDQPPTVSELEQMLSFLKQGGGSFKRLFNVSGQQYREMNIGEKIKAGMSEDEAIKLLAQNGKLIKRPFLLAANFGLIGFKKEQWDETI